MYEIGWLATYLWLALHIASNLGWLTLAYHPTESDIYDCKHLLGSQQPVLVIYAQFRGNNNTH